MQIFIARQPIFDSQLKVVGYELLSRSGNDNVFQHVDGDKASDELVSRASSVWGLDELAQGKKSFVNLTRSALMDQHFRILPPENTVLEILESVQLDSDVMDACQQAKDLGYTIALDDYILEKDRLPILKHFDIIKMDFADTKHEDRLAFMKENIDLPCKWLAEKIEHHDDYFSALNQGFTLFQGFFFCKPQMIERHELPSCKINALRFIEQVQRPDFNQKALEQIIRSDIALSYKLLKYLNSAGMGLRNKVDSIGHAMRLLGQQNLRRWASLIAVAGLGEGKPNELMNVALTRAKMCELLTTHCQEHSYQEFDPFTLGLFSTLDAMLDLPMEQAVSDLNLHTMLVETLLGRETPIAPIYQITISLEKGQFDKCESTAQKLGLTNETVQKTYRDAIAWATQSMTVTSEQQLMRQAS